MIPKKILLEWQKRVWWMNMLFLFCLYMTFVYLPFDIFLKPLAEDEEVWFGWVFHEWAAKLTAPFHWLIYGFGSFGFFKMRAWMWPWAALYLGQISLGMLVWNIFDPRGGGLILGLVTMMVFLIPTLAIWRAKDKFLLVKTEEGV
ncbi:MAG: hypothetical protein KUG75_05300 [Pseudomonadales bacterium]|nr:hypothetical protein [Pseudomonadales bacterium]